MRQHSQLQTLHIVSHGSPGCVYLGNSELSLNTLKQYTPQLKNWLKNRPLKPTILLYGCQIAAGDAGEELVNKLHQITGAPIAASNTLTGNQALGGDWEFQVKTSDFEVALAFSEVARQSYPGVLATFEVNTNKDIVDENEKITSLREAIELANQSDGPDTITFAPALEGQRIIISKSSLNIQDDVEIVAPESGNKLTIRGKVDSGLTTIFNIDDQDPENQIEVSIKNLKITDNNTTEQELVAISNNETLTLEKVNIDGVSQAISNLSNTSILNVQTSNILRNLNGLDNSGTATINSSTFKNNADFNGTYAIKNNAAAKLQVYTTRIFKNYASIINYGTASIFGSKIFRNDRNGIESNDKGSLSIQRSQIYKNLTGISSSGSKTEIKRTNIYNNSASGIVSNDLTLDITESAIYDNNDSGITLKKYGLNRQVNITNSTISDNTGNQGGGINMLDYLTLKEGVLGVKIINSTITGNTAPVGGGISITTGKAQIGNTIIYGNSDGKNDLSVDQASFESLGNNIIGASEGLNSNAFTSSDKRGTNANPKLEQLNKKNGGITPTQAFKSGSTAHNAGNNQLAENEELKKDQRGGKFERIVDNTVDIGAFELQTQSKSPSGVDLLSGAQSPPTKIDTLTGTSEADLFKLGNREFVRFARHGLNDYVIITNFDPNQDVIRLHGAKQDYDLEQTSQDSTKGIGIYLKGAHDHGQELIAIVTGVSSFSLGGDYCSFV